MAFLGQEEQLRELQNRFRYIYFILAAAFLILVSRMVFLQILMGDKMRRYSEDNRIKRVQIPAPRGMIYDRNKVLLIDNRPAFDLEVTPQYLRESKNQGEVISKLSLLIGMSTADIEKKIQQAGTPTFMPVKIKTNLTRDEVAKIITWQITMPGVSVETQIKRTSVFGDVGAHLLGYIAQVSPSELDKLKILNKDYNLNDTIGKMGLEQKMEAILRGEDGEKLVEVDALGRIKQTATENVLRKEHSKPEIPGKNLVLTIDQDLQEAAVAAFEDKSGAAIAIDPKTGEILAMVSRPSFDSTEFSRGIPPELWAKLQSDENKPFRNKSIQDHYPPGSVFKAVTAIAGLEEGVIDEKTTFRCSGSYRVGNRVYHCHKKQGHGEVNVVSALTQSCDVFFYRVAQKLKSVDQIAVWSRKFGLGERTNIPLAHEVPGLVPTEEWKFKRYNEQWTAGETLSIAIGQGYLLTTNIQLGNLYAALANHGIRYQPFVVKRIEDVSGNVIKEFKPKALVQTELSPKTYELVTKGLWGVVNSPYGTAYRHMLPEWEYAGKTGTVQVIQIAADKIYQKCVNMKYRDRHHGLFAGFGPIHNPSIAVAIIAEHSCSGSGGAAPIGRAILKKFFEKNFPVNKKKEPNKPIEVPSAGGIEE